MVALSASHSFIFFRNYGSLIMSNEQVVISFVGDMSFADLLFCQGFGVRSAVEKNGPDFLFSKVKHFFSPQTDISFGNLETILSRYGEDRNSLRSVDMRGDPACAAALKNAGFTLLNMANNHSMQHGPVAFNETVNLLKSYGISQLGIKSKVNGASLPIIIKKKGMKIGFLGYSFEPDRYSPSPLYCNKQDSSIEEEIIRLKKNVDILILSVHWGLENISRPSVFTIQRARNYIDAGVDVIIGHHPHVLQGMEKYNGKLIFYSLGNFIFDMNWSKKFRESIILKIIIKNCDDIDYNFVPVFIDGFCRPIPLNGEKKKRFFKKFEKLSRDITLEMEGDLEKKLMYYYKDVMIEMKRQRYLSYIYFLKNFYRYKKKFLLQQLIMTISSRIEDFRN